MRLPDCLRRLLKEEHGFSLLELLTTMVIMTIVLGGLTTVFVSGSKAEYDMNRRFQAQQQTRLALDRIRRDVHTASCVGYDTTTPGTWVTLSGKDASGNCPGTVFAYYCVASSTNGYAMYTAPSVLGSCTLAAAKAASASTVGDRAFVADYLTTNNIFSWTQSTGQQLQKLTVDLKVDAASTTTGGVYELKDDIVLRNSLRT